MQFFLWTLSKHFCFLYYLIQKTFFSFWICWNLMKKNQKFKFFFKNSILFSKFFEFLLFIVFLLKRKRVFCSFGLQNKMKIIRGETKNYWYIMFFCHFRIKKFIFFQHHCNFSLIQFFFEYFHLSTNIKKIFIKNALI